MGTTSPLPSRIRELEAENDELQARLDGKGSIYYTTPASTENLREGDTLFDGANGNRISRWVGGQWEPMELGTSALAALSITEALIAEAAITNAKIGNIDAGKITTGTLSADVLEGTTVTGALIQSDAAPNRGGKFTTAGLETFDSVGTRTFHLNFQTGDLSAVGVFQTSNGGARAKLWNRNEAGTLDLYTGSGGQHGAVIARPHTEGGFATGLLHFADDNSDAVAGVDIFSRREVRAFTRDAAGIINNQMTLAVDGTGPYMQNKATYDRKHTGTGRTATSNRPVVVTAAGTLGVLDNAAGTFHRLDIPRLPCRHFTASGDQDIPNGAWTTWTSLVAGPGDQTPAESGISFSAGVATVAIAGYYRLEGQISYSGNTAGTRYVAFRLNGANGSWWRTMQTANGTGTMSVASSRTLYLAAGATVEMLGYQTSGATLRMIGLNNPDLTGWSITYVSQ